MTGFFVKLIPSKCFCYFVGSVIVRLLDKRPMGLSHSAP